jgi:hypothetical protein
MRASLKVGLEAAAARPHSLGRLVGSATSTCRPWTAAAAELVVDERAQELLVLFLLLL